MVDDWVWEESTGKEGDESQESEADQELPRQTEIEEGSTDESSDQQIDSTASRTQRLWHTDETDESQQNLSSETSQQDANPRTDKQESDPRESGQAESDRSGSAQEENEPETHNHPSATESSFDDLIERSGTSNRSDRSRGRHSEAENTNSSVDEVAELFNDLNAFDRAMAGSQILILSPTNHSITDSICSEFVTVGGAAGRDIVSVTTTQSPTRRLEIIQNTPEWAGGQVAIIEVGDLATSDNLDDESVIYKRISNPKKLQKLGLVITQTLKEWSSRDRPATLCFHTISEISNYVQNPTLFQFLYTLQAKLNSMGVTAHYHMDPAEHDAQDPDTFKSMFDLVLRVSQDGSIEIE